MNNEPNNDHLFTWIRLADLGNQTDISPATLRRWAQQLPQEQATKKPKEKGGQPEWWVRSDIAEAYLIDRQATIKQQSSSYLGNEQANDHNDQGNPLALTMSHVEARLARIEGALAGQWVSEFTEHLSKLTEANELLRQEAQQREERYLQELKALREEMQQREKQHNIELTSFQEESRRMETDLTTTLGTLREELTVSRQSIQRKDEELHQKTLEAQKELTVSREETQQQLKAIQEAAQQREIEIIAKMDALQKALSKPWWRKLWPQKKENTSG